MTIRIDGTNTAANPGITGTDTDTGLQFGTDEVNIVTGGTTRATVDSSGFVGIGVTSPSNPIHVVHSSSTVATAFFNNTSTGGDSPALIVQGGANNTNTTGTFEVRDYNGNTDFKVQGTGELQFNSGYGSVATAYGVRAWARINGTGTISEYGKGGFSSITDQSTGVYRFNFTNSMPDTNYAVAGSTDTNTVFQVNTTFNTAYIDTSIQNQSGSTADSDDVSVIVVR